MKLSIDTLDIETTRKCNFNCLHCMRGDSQNLNIDNTYIDKLFNLLCGVYEIRITGGEPSLNISALEHLIEAIKINHVEVNTISVVLNGQTQNMGKFVQVMKKLFALCNHPEQCVVGISVDKFHGDSDPGTNYIKSLDAFKRLKQNADIRIKIHEGALTGIRAIGRAEKMEDAIEVPDVNYPVFIHENLIQSICMTVNGDLVNSKDYSYETADKRENHICHITEVENAGGLIDKIQNWNDREVVSIGALIVLSGRISGACLFCSQYWNMYQKSVNKISQIVNSEYFQNLSDSAKGDWLEKTGWYSMHQHNVNSDKCGNISDFCQWWKEPDKNHHEAVKRKYRNIWKLSKMAYENNL
ncbi:MAG: radical SAM protein [Eubacteriales bacterium]|nr:radical SAM protein [Eubacteriales bacterium]